MRDKLLLKLAGWHSKHPWKMLMLVVLITVILGKFAGQISITMRTQDLLPKGDPKVDQFNEIIDEFATATSIIVVAQGEEEKIKAFADDLAPRAIELMDTSLNTFNLKKIQEIRAEIEKQKKNSKEEKIAALEEEIKELQNRINFKLFQRVDYKSETDFLQNHALMLIKADDLENTQDMFTDPNLTGLLTNLNNSMEKEYVGKEESISTREKEDNAVNFLDGLQTLALTLQQAAKGENLNEEETINAADEFLFGESYFISYDKKALILNVIPNFTIMDRDLLMVGAETMQLLVDDVLKDHPEVTAGLSGDIAREHDEQIASEQSLSFSTIIALVAILVLLIVSFRMLVAPVLAIVNLFVGILWAYGAAYILVGQLNMMTAMLSIVLLGLGIDFSIHLVSGLTEFRAMGQNIKNALESTFMKTGKGVITGALTTACAFLTLLISQSRGMKEMGIVTGIGLLSIMLSSFIFLPNMLVFRERYVDWRQKRKSGTKPLKKRDITFQSLGIFSSILSHRYLFTISGTVIVSVFLVWSALQIEYDRNYMSLEPEGLTSLALQDTITEKFDLSMEYALCLADGLEESRRLSEEYRDLAMVARTNDISLYFPSENEQYQRIPYIKNIREKMQKAPVRLKINKNEIEKLITGIERLEMNVMEMQDMAFIGGQDKVDEKCKAIVGDPDIPDSPNIFRKLVKIINSDRLKAIRGLSVFQKYFAPYFKQNVINMCSTEPISLEELPISVLDQYSNKDRTKFMITIYPGRQLYTDSRIMNRFVDDVNRVSEKTTGGPPVAAAWMKIAARDGRNAILLTLVIVFFLLWADFRNPGYALMAMLPLALGAFWMVGIMNLSGMLLNFMTMMGIPLIIGIGIDDGVHVIHRWRHEGRGQIKIVFSSTGKAVLLTSLTTMLAFGSMIFSVFPAWISFGASLFIGVGACFLTTIIILPGIIGWIERKKR